VIESTAIGAEIERVHVGLAERAYDIAIGPGLLAQSGALLRPMIGGRGLVIVSDETVAELYLAKLQTALEAGGFETPRSVIVPPGEPSKSIQSFGRAAEEILGIGIDRRSVIVALGGGVVGDLAGFLAATLLRGIDFIQMPTTLLAQVDSSVGGKTAIDSRHGKNLIGAFHQPLFVLADTETLTTLPPRELKAGYAEIVKYGVLGDREFFEWLEENGGAALSGDPAALTSAIAKSCNAKARIVEGDERESGRRALLNLGHTFAHALEAETGFGDGLNHGEAVSIGMVLALDLSVRLGHCPSNDLMRLRGHLLRHGLPVSPPRSNEFSPSSLVQRMRGDKKAERGTLTFVLARGIGDAFIARGVNSSVVETTLLRALAA
jgi:3-dehydroquinate synthase